MVDELLAILPTSSASGSDGRRRGSATPPGRATRRAPASAGAATSPWQSVRSKPPSRPAVWLGSPSWIRYTPRSPRCRRRKRRNGLDVVRGVLRARARPASIRPVVDDQEQQELTVPCRMYSNSCCSIEPGTARRIGFRSSTWKLGTSSAADGPDAPAGQPLGVGVAPEHLLGPLLEPRVEAGRPPVPRAVRLQVHLVQDPADHGRADRSTMPSATACRARSSLRPVGDVQAPRRPAPGRPARRSGRAGGGEICGGLPSGAGRPAAGPGRLARSGGRGARPWTGRTASAAATSCTRWPSATASTMRACWTWKKGSDRLRATS